MARSIESRSEAETIEIGRQLAGELPPGAVVLLSGELGAGKTAFVKGLAAGLGIEQEEVSSPTFTLVQEYRGRLTLFHVDLYRIGGTEAEDLGLEELESETSIVAIEWADKLPRPPGDAVRVRIADRGGDLREISIERRGRTST
jgi:tRNA threonylcarbamoyladenosine biosynthesis protein TsaE